MMTNARLFLGELYGSRNVLAQLVSQQLILRYRRTVLGYFWTFINPLLLMSVMALVFAALFKSDLKNFAVFLFAAAERFAAIRECNCCARFFGNRDCCFQRAVAAPNHQNMHGAILFRVGQAVYHFWQLFAWYLKLARGAASTDGK